MKYNIIFKIIFKKIIIDEIKQKQIIIELLH